MAKEAIYVPIDNVKRTPGKKGSPSKIEFTKDSPVYGRVSTTGRFVRTGTITSGGVRAATAQEKQSDAIRVAEQAKETQRLEAEKQRLAAQKELQEIQRKIAIIKSQGGQPRFKDTILLRNGQRVPARIIEYQKGANKVRIVEDKNSGRVRYEQYGTGRGGGSVRQIRGFETVGPTREEIMESNRKGNIRIEKTGDPNRLNVITPSGKIVSISAKGKVVIGAALAGRKLEFFNGQLIEEIEPSRSKSYITLNSSEEAELKKMLPNYTTLVKVDGKVVGIRDARTNKTYSVAKIDEYIEEKSRKDFEAKGKTYVSLYNLSNRWTNDISNTKSRLTAANKRRDIDRLQELNIKERNKSITEKEKLEKQRLLKETAENYRLAGEMVGKVIGTTLINMGLGTTELLKALKENPKATLAALPPAIYRGVKQDFNRVMTGDPLEIGQVGLEYYTMGRVFNALGKTAKNSFKVPMAIGKQLSPKYFSGIVRTLKIPSVSRVVLPASRRAKLSALSKTMANKLKVSKQYEKFIRNLRKNKFTSGKLDDIARLTTRTKRVVKKIRKVTKDKLASKIRRIQISQEYVKSLARARKLRIKAGKKYLELRPKTPDYSKALDILDDVANAVGEVKARQYILDYIKKGGKITKQQADDFVKAIKKYTTNKLNAMPDYVKLKQLNSLSRNVAIKLIKQKRINPAKIIVKRIMNKINNLRIVKDMARILDKIKRNIKINLQVIKKTRRIVKGKQKTEIGRLKSAIELNKELARAKRIRKLARKKGRKITIGNNDYVTAIDLLYDFADDLSRIRVREVVSVLKKKGKVLTSEDIKKLLRAASSDAKKALESFVEFKNLQNLARTSKPITFKLIKQGKIKTAKVFFKRLKLSLNKKVSNIINKYPKIKGSIRATKSIIRKSKKLKPSKIKANIRKASLKRARIKAFKQTNRYLMEKSRPIRKVTWDRLRKTNTITNTNKFIDDLFNEIGRRQKIDITSLKFLQMKNIIKKRIRKAINTGNKIEIDRFKNAMKKLIDDLNSSQKQPLIRVIEKGKGSRSFRTLRGNDIQSPTGTFKEVKVGNQILLQKVETVKPSIVKPRTKQVLVVKSVSKVKFDWRPVVRYLSSAFAVPIINTLQKSGNRGMVKTSQIPKIAQRVGQDFAQDFKIVQSVLQSLGINVAQNIAQDVNQRFRQPQKQKQKQKYKEKEKKIKLRMPRSSFSRGLDKAKQVYAVKVKKGNKLVTLSKKPLLLNDAKDYLAYNLDNRTLRTAFIVPVGVSKNVSSSPSNAKGYYQRTKNKYREYKIKKGKKKILQLGFIEKRKYFQDTPGEKASLRKLRRGVRSKPQRAIAKKRRISPTQRRELLRRLKKARMVRMRNLRKRK